MSEDFGIKSKQNNQNPGFTFKLIRKIVKYYPSLRNGGSSFKKRYFS
jgi:hypothetical protein